MNLFTFYVIRLLILAFLTFFLSLFLSKPLLNFLIKIKFFKKKPREKAITGEVASIYYSLHKEREVSTPRGGGIVIWLSVLLLTILFFLLSKVQNPWWMKKFNFLSRHQTWLPLFALIVGSFIGLVDDIFTVYGSKNGNGLSFWRRFFIVTLIGVIGGWWFYFKLGWETIHIPLIFNFPEGIDFRIGIFYIPLFTLVMLACWAGGVIDGLDGLAGGVFSSIFGAFSIIAFSQGKVDLATFSAMICGSLFAFLWYNIPPAKFYMGETGVLGLTSTMATLAFLTDSVIVLPIIAFPMVIEVGSIIFQIFSKKFFKKKIWLSTPIHNHLEAIGWKSYQITMRFWIIAIVFAILGVALRMMG